VVEPVSFERSMSRLGDPPSHRHIFPDKTGTRSNNRDKDDMPRDSNGSRARAKQARLERAARRRAVDDDE